MFSFWVSSVILCGILFVLRGILVFCLPHQSPVLHSSPLDRVLGSLSGLCLLKCCSSSTLSLRLSFQLAVGSTWMFYLDIPPTAQNHPGGKSSSPTMISTLFHGWQLFVPVLGSGKPSSGATTCNPRSAQQPTPLF